MKNKDYTIRVEFSAENGKHVIRTYDIFQVESEKIAIECAKQIFFHDFGLQSGAIKAWVVMAIPAQVGIRIPKEKR